MLINSLISRASGQQQVISSEVFGESEVKCGFVTDYSGLASLNCVIQESTVQVKYDCCKTKSDNKNKEVQIIINSTTQWICFLKI